jgi:hypothetical protein
VEEIPDAVPALGLTVGLGLEQLRGFLRHRFGTASWRVAVRRDPAGLIAAFDQEYEHDSSCPTGLGHRFEGPMSRASISIRGPAHKSPRGRPSLVRTRSQRTARLHDRGPSRLPPQHHEHRESGG